MRILILLTSLIVSSAYADISELGDLTKSRVEGKLKQNPIGYVPNYQEPLPQEDSDTMELRGRETLKDSKISKILDSQNNIDMKISSQTLGAYNKTKGKTREELNKDLKSMVNQYSDCDQEQSNKSVFKYCDSVREGSCQKGHKYACFNIEEQVTKECIKELQVNVIAAEKEVLSKKHFSYLIGGDSYRMVGYIVYIHRTDWRTIGHHFKIDDLVFINFAGGSSGIFKVVGFPRGSRWSAKVQISPISYSGSSSGTISAIFKQTSEPSFLDAKITEIWEESCV